MDSTDIIKQFTPYVHNGLNLYETADISKMLDIATGLSTKKLDLDKAKDWVLLQDKNYFRVNTLLSYVNKEWESRGIRWMIGDDSGNVSCDKCGNIANAVLQFDFGICKVNIPVCKKHVIELENKIPFDKDDDVAMPCVLQYIPEVTLLDLLKSNY